MPSNPQKVVQITNGKTTGWFCGYCRAEGSVSKDVNYGNKNAAYAHWYGAHGANLPDEATDTSDVHSHPSNPSTAAPPEWKSSRSIISPHPGPSKRRQRSPFEILLLTPEEVAAEKAKSTAPLVAKVYDHQPSRSSLATSSTSKSTATTSIAKSSSFGLSKRKRVTFEHELISGLTRTEATHNPQITALTTQAADGPSAKRHKSSTASVVSGTSKKISLTSSISFSPSSSSSSSTSSSPLRHKASDPLPMPVIPMPVVPLPPAVKSESEREDQDRYDAEEVDGEEYPFTSTIVTYVRALDPFRIVLVKEHGLIVCLQCLSCIPANALQGHFIKWHKGGDQPWALPTNLEAILLLHDIPNQGQPPTRPIAPIPGLYSPSEGYRCRVKGCGAAALTIKSFKANHKEHTETPKSAMVQKIYANNKHTGAALMVWPVEPNFTSAISSPDPGHKVMLLDIMNEHTAEASGRRGSSAPNGDARLVSPFLRLMGWMAVTVGKDLIKISHMASLPSTAEMAKVPAFNGIGTAVHALYDSIKPLVRQTSVNLLRHMRTPRPGELDNKPFGLLQERSTEKRYVNWAVRLVAMAIRICFAQRSGHTLEMETNLTDNQQRYANELYDLLSKKYRGTKPTSADPNADLEWSEDPGEYIDEEMENDPIGSANGKPPAGALPTDKIDVAIQTLVYKLLHALYFTMHPDTESQASKDPISVYLLSIHINPKTGTFAKPVSITPNVAGIQWNMAPIGIRYAHELATATTMPKDDEDGSACPVFKVGEKFSSRWMKEGFPGPFSTIRQLMTLASRYAYSANHVSTFNMSSDRTEFFVFGKQVQLDRLAGAYHNGIQDLKAKLAAITADIPLWAREALSRADIVDDMTKDTPGYSFLDNVEVRKIMSTGLQVKMNTTGWLLPPRSSTPASDTRRPWNPYKAKEFMEQSRDIQTLLITLMHIGQGQPARGTEITALLVRNMGDAHRSLFMLQGSLMTILGYNKTNSNTSEEKLIPRYPHAELAELLRLYFVFVRIQEQEFSSIVYTDLKEEEKESFKYYAFVKNGRPWKSHQLSDALKNFTFEYLGVSLGISAWRHAAAGLGKELELGIIDPLERKVEDATALQQGHSNRTNEIVYAVYSDQKGGCTHKVLLVYRNISDLWHVTILKLGSFRKHPKTLRELTANPMTALLDDNEEEEDKKATISIAAVASITDHALSKELKSLKRSIVKLEDVVRRQTSDFKQIKASLASQAKTLIVLVEHLLPQRKTAGEPSSAADDDDDDDDDDNQNDDDDDNDDDDKNGDNNDDNSDDDDGDDDDDNNPPHSSSSSPPLPPPPRVLRSQRPTPPLRPPPTPPPSSERAEEAVNLVLPSNFDVEALQDLSIDTDPIIDKDNVAASQVKAPDTDRIEQEEIEEVEREERCDSSVDEANGDIEPAQSIHNPSPSPSSSLAVSKSSSSSSSPSSPTPVPPHSILNRRRRSLPWHVLPPNLPPPNSFSSPIVLSSDEEEEEEEEEIAAVRPTSASTFAVKRTRPQSPITPKKIHKVSHNGDDDDDHPRAVGNHSHHKKHNERDLDIALRQNKRDIRCRPPLKKQKTVVIDIVEEEEEVEEEVEEEEEESEHTPLPPLPPTLPIKVPEIASQDVPRPPLSPITLSSCTTPIIQSIDHAVEEDLGGLMNNPSFRFRNYEQAKVYDILVNRKGHVCSISATSSGKTLPIQATMLKLQSVCREVRALFCLPYRNTYQEMEDRFKAAGLSCSLWGTENMNPLETVILVPLDLVLDPNFQSFARAIAAEKKLALAVLDEAHGAIEDVGWRPTYQVCLKFFFSLPHTIVCLLTATMAPQFQHLLLEQLEVETTLHQAIHFVRRSVQRRNIRHEIINFAGYPGADRPLDSSTFDRLTAAFVMDMMAYVIRLFPGMQAIAFVRSPAEVEYFANEIFNCPFLHGQMTNEEKDRQLRRWSNAGSPSDRLLITNKAGVSGTNNPNIVLSFTIRWLTSLSDIVQGPDGRPARDPETVGWHFGVLNGVPLNWGKASPEQPDGPQALQHMLRNHHGCIPLAFGKFFDGPGTVGESPKECKDLVLDGSSDLFCSSRHCQPIESLKIHDHRMARTRELARDIPNNMRPTKPINKLTPPKSSSPSSSSSSSIKPVANDTPSSSYYHQTDERLPSAVLLYDSITKHHETLASSFIPAHVSNEINGEAYDVSLPLLPGHDLRPRRTHVASGFDYFIQGPLTDTPAMSRSPHIDRLPAVHDHVTSLAHATGRVMAQHKLCLDEVKRLLNLVYPSIRVCWCCWKEGSADYDSHISFDCPKFSNLHPHHPFDAWKRQNKLGHHQPGTSSVHPICGFDQSSPFYHGPAPEDNPKAPPQCVHPDTILPMMYIMDSDNEMQHRLWKFMRIIGAPRGNDQSFVDWCKQSRGKQCGTNANMWMVLCFLTHRLDSKIGWSKGVALKEPDWSSTAA